MIEHLLIVAVFPTQEGSAGCFLAQVFRFGGSLVPFKPAGLHPDSGLKCLLLDFVNDFSLYCLNFISPAVGFVDERVQGFKGSKV